jgi:uncharacterized protein (TIGR03083 family)
MGDPASIFEGLRKELSDLFRGLSPEELSTPVPATPAWTILDIAAHLAGDASSVIAGDFPREFFEAFGDEGAVVALNRWTGEHVSSRAGLSLEEILEEWETSSRTLMSMMSGDGSMGASLPPFADRVLITDLAVHQHDIYGALKIEREREAAPVRMASAGYVAMIGFRLSSTEIPPLRIAAGDSERTTGEGEPGATVRASRFEMFRALSGRRSPEQIKSYEWQGDPEPYIPYFYPYGIRHEALVE